MTLPIGKRPNNVTGGFTLIEVLIAVFVLSSGISLVLYSFDACITALASSSDSIKSQLLLREMMDSVVHDGLPAEDSGRFDGGYSDFRWRIAGDGPLRQGQSGPAMITVTVQRGAYGAASSLTTLAVLNRDTVRSMTGYTVGDGPGEYRETQ